MTSAGRLLAVATEASALLRAPRKAPEEAVARMLEVSAPASVLSVRMEYWTWQEKAERRRPVEVSSTAMETSLGATLRAAARPDTSAAE
jgi:hypothetical protein